MWRSIFCSHYFFYKKQRGQALPLGIAFIMFGALLTLVLFNTSQMATEKSRLANASDAAVYSGLVWQARALNFQAYTNRAMIANQVTIAQIVSITSWTNYGRISARNIDAAIGWIPFLTPFTKGLLAAMTQIELIIEQIAEIAVPVIDQVNQALSEAQQAVYVATFAITPSIIDEVVKANDPNYNAESAYALASVGQNALAWRDFTTRYEDLDSLKRKANLINQSKDRFTSDRGWQIGRHYISPVHRFRLVKEGQTRLIYSEDDDEWAWKGKDNLSIHIENYKCSWRGCRWKNSEIPIGWGGAYVQNDIEQCQYVASYSNYSSEYDEVTYEKRCPRWMRLNERSEKLSDAEAIEIDGSYTGVQSYFDLKDLSANNRDPRLSLRVEVQVPQGGVRTSTKIDGIGSSRSPDEKTTKDGIGRGMFWAEDKMASSSMSSISSGEVFFERPAYRYRLGGNKKEYGSLFNPYWQVRLTETTAEQRMAAWAIRSPELLASSASGVATGVQRYASQQLQELESLQAIEADVQEQLANIDQAIATREQQIQGEISNVEAEIAQVEQNIVNTGNDTVAAIEQNERLVALQERQSQLQNDLSQAATELQSQLETRLSDTQSQIASVQESISQQVDSVAESFSTELRGAQALANDLQRVSSGAGLRQYGEDQLRNYAEDLIEEQLEQALTSAATSILSRYGGSVYESAQQTYASIEQGIEEVTQNVEETIRPLQEQIDGMQAQIQQVEQAIRDQYELASNELDEAISQLENSIDSRVASLEDSLQNQMDELTERRDGLTDQLQIDALQAEIDSVGERLSSEPDNLRVQLQESLSNLIGQQESLVDDLQGDIASTQSDMAAQISVLQAQIDNIRDKISL